MVTGEMLTVNEVAEYLRVNPQTVYRKAKAGELPAVRIGRVIRFRKAELEAWLDQEVSAIAGKGRHAV